jgi:MFS family permease
MIGDFYTVEERGLSTGYYTALPLIGFALSPIPAGFLVEHTTWRWAFHILSILAAITTILGFFFLRETYAPVLLQEKKRARAHRRGEGTETVLYDRWKVLAAKWRVALPRPFRLLATQPLLQMMALYAGYIFGLDYLAITTFPKVWLKFYHERPDISSINYVSLAIGFTLASQVMTPLQDKVWA